jgi:2-keto-4-pentenoate hydratase/2-oxohepta-3-ene-1,7-dioic acid hydratase in catechol pathway
LIGRESVMKIGRIETAAGLEWVVAEDGEIRTLDGDPFSERWAPGGVIDTGASTRPGPPVTPSKIVCVGRNYIAHAAEHGADVPTEPLLFLKPPSAVIGFGAEIVLPELSDQVEHEAELALVMGRRCRGVSPDQAWRHVLGVTCANDVTARDLQRSDAQWTRGKGFDTFCPLGPWIVSGLSEEEVGNLGVRCTVNGEVRQQARTSQMVFSPSVLIAYITAVMTLEPGDLILTGTPAGVSPLNPGDEVTVEIERVGTLTNPVISAG